jgi:putative transposase
VTGKNKTETVPTEPAAPVVDRQVVAELVAAAQAEGMPLSGEGGLLAQLTKIVFELDL